MKILLIHPIIANISFSLTALITLGIKDINECPEGVNEDKISHETFETEA